GGGGGGGGYGIKKVGCGFLIKEWVGWGGCLGKSGEAGEGIRCGVVLSGLSCGGLGWLGGVVVCWGWGGWRVRMG
ncbi:hypothetical protein, partial [Lacticaseibacillus rhamnosus]|uniref:hypothetical protein n=1 Tax=Lacticaseibacillus rhamnosus TaxID=47715 RepID=UPI0019EE62DE